MSKKEKAKDPKRVEAAKRAWVTIRKKQEAKAATSKPVKPKPKPKTKAKKSA